MQNVKIFSRALDCNSTLGGNSFHEDLENDINRWIKENNAIVQDIKYTMHDSISDVAKKGGYGEVRLVQSALVIYTNRGTSNYLENPINNGA